MQAAQQILERLRAYDIDTVFGYPGGCIMPLYDALLDCPAIEHVLCRHEQGCALAADGYARASGRVGVCIATSGPGATNLITGVANAHRDSVPLLVITGQTPSDAIGTDAFQEIDVLGMTLDIVKHSRLVTRADDVGPAVDEALALAATGRPGPVWLDIPKDVLTAHVAPMPNAPRPPGAWETGTRRLPAAEPIAELVDLLRRARQPLVYSGGGIARAGAETAFHAFLRAANLPHVTSLNGLGNGGHDDTYPLGMLGMHGAPAANHAVDDCDLLLVVGARLDDRATGRLDGFAPNARLVHIDIDASELGKRRAARLAFTSNDLAGTLDALTAALNDTPPLSIAAWRRRCQQAHARDGFVARLARRVALGLNGPTVIRALSERAPEDTVISCDVGQHQMWVAQYYDFTNPRCHLTSGGLGTMGFGLPAAIGACFARPDGSVVQVSGDGSFMMNLQELATVARYRLAVKCIVLDNGCLGMVRQQQELFLANRESQIALDDNPDFAAVARAFGLPTQTIDRTAQLTDGLDALFATPGPALLHVRIPRADNVWPTVAPGAANRDMLDEPVPSAWPRAANL